MLTVRELKELTVRLDVEALARQLGPFVFVQHPLSASASKNAGLVTRALPNPGAPPRGVFDFEDLWVATLPPLARRDSFVLGRSPDCEFVIDEESVSKQHAQIDWNDGIAVLHDLRSANGVFVNGQKVAIHKLTDNDLITLGSARMFFMLVATLRRRMGITNSDR
ncbi:MAG: FHA domain-containing protein [Archangium sp.]|nr:FHA domain-containing protein [Archangium sp.]MDP3151640.1 FHA domain-containing protein [Archangium sp.]MDP3569175.1 FHA domain-containing protein [Archangium sp.]